MSSQPVIHLDLTRQKLLIKPDDPLPRFHPPPKAIMVTPIYDYDVQLSASDNRERKSANVNGSSHQRGSLRNPRHSSAYAPSYMHYPTDSNDYSHGSKYEERYYDRRNSRSRTPPRRHRSYDAQYSRPGTPSTIDSYDPHNRAVYTDSEYSNSSPRDSRGHASSYSPPPRHRREYSRTPSRERYDSSRVREDDRQRVSYPYGDDRSYSHRYSSYPQSYNQDLTRERPSDDPIAQRPPNYQIQATSHGQQEQGAHPRPSGQVPSHATPSSQHSAHRPNRHSVDYAYDPPLEHSIQGSSVAGSHGNRLADEYGRPPTSASLYAGRSPFFPPGGESASRPVSTLSPSATGAHMAPSIMTTWSGGGGAHGSSNFLDEMVQNYLKLLPPNPDWRPSKCTGRKKAVCIGINYVGQRKELRGCFNDAKSMREFLIRQHNFPPSEILLLTDVDPSLPRPTRKELFNAFMWLVKDAKAHDSLFIHYSGHGGQSPDASGREADGMDDTIFPVDFQQEGDIIDDELNKALVEPLPSGCRLTAIFDSCHSGTVLDLPYLHSAHGRLRGLQHISARAITKGTGPKPDVICFSACKDDEKSADTFQNGVAVGAMSFAFIECLNKNPRETYGELLARIRQILIPKYQQKPQISGTHPLDMSREFTI